MPSATINIEGAYPVIDVLIKVLDKYTSGDIINHLKYVLPLQGRPIFTASAPDGEASWTEKGNGGLLSITIHANKVDPAILHNGLENIANEVVNKCGSFVRHLEIEIKEFSRGSMQYKDRNLMIWEFENDRI